MDFFGAQEQAKKRTTLAIVLFVLGVLATALTLYVVVVWFLFSNSKSSDEISAIQAPLWLAQNRPDLFLWSVGGVAGIILAASVYKISSMGAGGISIAQMLGARFIDERIDGENERRLKNIVEEMALASGYSIPAVGVLDDELKINAFAAALNQRDAVIVVTRGALEKLNRDELQAVVAHEFSHLLNGDSRMNITLAGWVFGLFFITIIGRFFMRARGKKSGGFVLLGVIIFIIGLIGWTFGRIIQALISRQREFLADASSVQFTRNPQAMVAALGKIASGWGSGVKNPSATGLAHFFFASANGFNGFDGLLATHPPLEKRMEAIDWNYKQVLETLPRNTETEDETSTGSSAQATFTGTDKGSSAEGTQNPPPPQISPQNLLALVASVGVASAASMNRISESLATLPASITSSLQTPSGAQAIILGLAIPAALPAESANAAPSSPTNGHPSFDSLLATLQPCLSAEVYRPLYEAVPTLAAVEAKQRIMLAQLACARVRQITPEEKISLAQALETIIAFDGKLTTFEALYAELVRHWLGLEADYPTIAPAEAASRVLSFLYAGQNVSSSKMVSLPNPQGAKRRVEGLQENKNTQAPTLTLPQGGNINRAAPYDPLKTLEGLQRASATLDTEILSKLLEDLVLPREIRPIKYVSTVALREALPSLLGFSFLQRRELLIAAGRILKLDEVVTDEEAETLRALAGIMDCPMPSRV